MRTADATFEIRSWKEAPYAELEDGRKLTEATVEQTFGGDLRGDGVVRYLMCYRPDGTATFLGMQRVTGELGDRPGEFVLRVEGEFDGREARADWSVVPQSATGALDGLSGRGGFSAPHGGPARATLEYDLG